MSQSQNWSENDRRKVLDVLTEFTPEQQAQFPDDIRRGDRTFSMTERWLIDEFLEMQPGQCYSHA